MQNVRSIKNGAKEGQITWGDGRLTKEIAVISTVILWKVAIKNLLLLKQDAICT